MNTEQSHNYLFCFLHTQFDFIVHYPIAINIIQTFEHIFTHSLIHIHLHAICTAFIHSLPLIHTYSLSHSFAYKSNVQWVINNTHASIYTWHADSERQQRSSVQCYSYGQAFCLWYCEEDVRKWKEHEWEKH